MSRFRRSRTSSFGIVAVLAVTLSAPIAVHAEDQPLPAEDQLLTLEPIAGTSITNQAPSDIRSAPGATAPASSVEASRVNAAQHALLSHDLGSLQEEALIAVVASAMTWDETSGYGAFETGRITIEHPVASTTTALTRALIAKQALQSRDLGSLQEEALAAFVVASSAEDDATVDDTLASTRAALLAEFRSLELSSSRLLGAGQ